MCHHYEYRLMLVCISFVRGERCACELEKPIYRPELWKMCLKIMRVLAMPYMDAGITASTPSYALRRQSMSFAVAIYIKVESAIGILSIDQSSLLSLPLLDQHLAL